MKSDELANIQSTSMEKGADAGFLLKNRVWVSMPYWLGAHGRSFVAALRPRLKDSSRVGASVAGSADKT